MSADRARLSYAKARKYREVVSLQGRVALEADANEGQRIFSEEVRTHALDFVGPCGTPDDGYAVTEAGGTLSIGPGTMYVGGIRTTAEQGFSYDAQPDWIDTALPQPWTLEPFRPRADWTPAEQAALILREQEVSVAEDPALREVALGGPDSAARTRMLQRVLLAPIPDANCASAAKSMHDHWSGLGMIHDPQSAELKSRARLKVALVTGPAAATVCDPPAASGFLGADNQLIRFQIVAYDAATRTGKLLWAYNNASTIFRVHAADDVTLELEQRPVSVEFQPRSGQVVQVLMPAADLGEGAYAAAITGHWAKLATAYHPQTRRITLPAALPAVLLPPAAAAPPLLFLRLWDDAVDFTLETAATLTGTGLEVTISSADGGGMLHLGDHWSVAARPLTPNAVYPERYLDAPQPPDGPRMWACPLAAVAFPPAGAPTVIDDCRLPFDDLVELTARAPGESDDCCCITVRPEDAERLQDILDETAAQDGGVKVTVHFENGLYRLPRPLRLDARHNGMVLDGCTGSKPVLSAGNRDDPEFVYGLVLLLGVKDVTILGLQLDIAPVRIPDELLGQLTQAHQASQFVGDWRPEGIAIGFRAVRCLSLSIVSCLVRLPEVSGVYAAGVAIQGQNGKIAVRDCRFAGEMARGDLQDGVSIGVLLAPALINVDGLSEESFAEELVVEGCEFALLTVGMLVCGDVLFASAGANVTRWVHASFIALAYRNIRLAREIFQRMRELAEDARANEHPQVASLFEGIEADPQTYNALAISLLLSAEKLTDGLDERKLAYSFGDAPIETLPDADAVFADAQRFTLDDNRFGSYSGMDAAKSSGPDTLIWDLAVTKVDEQGLATATLTGNSMWNSGVLPTVAIVMCASFNITGNVIGNRFRQPGDRGLASLVVQPNHRLTGDGETMQDSFTATGNTFYGLTNLDRFPRREWMARFPPAFLRSIGPMLTWEFHNSINRQFQP